MSEDDRRLPSSPRSIQLKLSAELVERLDVLKAEYGLRSRGAIVERLLRNILAPDEEAASEETIHLGSQPTDAAEVRQQGLFDECGGLVLVTREGSGELVLDQDPAAERPGPGSAGWDDPADQRHAGPRRSPSGARGIDLPGFVRRRSEQVRESLRSSPAAAASFEPLPQLEAALMEQALTRAAGHWQELYGTPAGDAVLEAAMVWLAQEIWPQCDQSEGRPFSWSLVTAAMSRLSPAWPPGPPSFERVMVAAGILEDPFSGSTLEMRLPTLIRRFVHRFRRRRQGTSFQTLEHTMTLHGALKLLQLPTAPGHRLTLPEIREAYRQLALAHHPDSGGSEDTMRRLNEAYQLLKELYRTG